MDDVNNVLNNKNYYFNRAINSGRNRFAMVLHKQGDYSNRVVNFMISGTYMKPHEHEGSHRSEYIKLLDGEIKIIYFDSTGKVTSTHLLSMKDDGLREIIVPPNQFHTYVVTSDRAVTYETMDGIYDPITWKNLAMWAPEESSIEAGDYQKSLVES